MRESLRRVRPAHKYLEDALATKLPLFYSEIVVGMPPPDERLHTWRCECGAADCTAAVESTWEERDAVDHDPEGRNLWMIALGHQLRGAKEAVVLSANERFEVVLVVEEELLEGSR